MAILITGGTGKTSIRLARLLQKANVPFVLASRSANKKAPDGMQSVVFDWTDNSTYSNPFRHKFANGEKVTAVYLIAPEVLDPVPPMNAFLDYAVKEHGVKKFTLMSGSTLTKGGPYTGMVWQHLADLNTEYTILKCTWLDGMLFSPFSFVSSKDEPKQERQSMNKLYIHTDMFSIKTI